MIKKLPTMPLILSLSFNLILTLSLVFLLSKADQEPAHISQRLNELQSQLANLQQAVKNPSEKIDLSAVNQDFNHLETMIKELKTKDTSQLNQLVIESRTQLSDKLDAMHSVINSLDQKQHPIKYLSSSSLPFKIISIDSIQQVSVASVQYDYKTIPLEKSDALAGWTVLSIDFGKQTIEFENAGKEHVVVELEGADRHA